MNDKITSSEGSAIGASNVTELPMTLLSEHFLAFMPRLGCQPVRKTDVSLSDEMTLAPLYYTHADIVIFPPCTDNPNNSLMNLMGVEPCVKAARAFNSELFQNKKFLLFPIYQEWSVGFKPRKNWVLLVYNVAEDIFYSLDATGSYRGTLYQFNYSHLNGALAQAFPERRVPSVVQKYFNLQKVLDVSSSGHWILYFICQLTNGSTLESLRDLEKNSTTLQFITQQLTETMYQNRDAVVSDGPLLSGHLLLNDVVNATTASAVAMSSIAAVESSPPLSTVHSFEVESFEPQRYGSEHRPSTESSLLASSLVSGGPYEPLQTSAMSVYDPSPSWGSFFQLNVFSILILSGSATILIAFLCLASAPPLLSTTVAAGVFSAGTLLLAVGVFGKCGAFSSRVPPLHVEAHAQDLSQSSMSEYNVV